MLIMISSQCKKLFLLAIIFIISLWLGCSPRPYVGFPVTLSSDVGEERFESVRIDIVEHFYDLTFAKPDFQRLERYSKGAIGRVVSVKLGNSPISSATMAAIISDGQIRVPIGEPGMKDDQIESIKKAMESILKY
jgi:hypothetical protein